MNKLLSNGLPYNEVVDTICDALEVTEQIHAAVSDGIGITDLGTLIAVAPKAAEIRRDVPVFRAQMEDLTTEEADSVADDVAARMNQSKDGIVLKGVEAVQLSSEWYDFVDTGIDLTARTVAFGKGLFKKAA